MSYIPNMMNPMGMNNNMGMNMNIPQMNMGNYQQPQQSQQQMVSNQNNNNQPFLIVANMQEAKEKILGYNSCLWMRDSSLPYLYVKSTDATSTPHFSVLKLEDVTEQMLNNNVQQRQTEQFVPIQDFNNLNSKVEQLQNTMNYYSGMLNQVLAPQHNDTVVDVEAKEVKKVGRPPKVEKVGE